LGSFQLEQRTMLGETTDGGHGYRFFFLMGWISKLVDDVDDDYYYEYESPTETGMKISKLFFFKWQFIHFFLHDYE
jgi:hypothetical protein